MVDGNGNCLVREIPRSLSNAMNGLARYDSWRGLVQQQAWIVMRS